ncbi:histidinol-phosphatase [Paenibacillus sp. GSMTC-2017]|uniref:histidinol-phosphatase n=1 Tax=Paenibacillus sp. GSMTC-2017 TaxID=2794350 RepID=UPI0018DA357B|nr:histidinol-phosphatase [Paenibacillus sp. GSMTC-2017]MBH5319253.1 histidinol-phosphatase [Paenibacillus sp. GSMTC-2017]
MKFDLHTHHFRCGHADGNIEDYIIAGMDAGLHVIGISDHSPYFYHEEDQPSPKVAMARSDFENYVNEVLRLKEKYAGKIEVLLGVEADFFPVHVQAYRDAFAGVPFDYIIGSVHQVGGVSIFNRKRWGKLDESQHVDEKKSYYDLIKQSARSGMYDILGHIDAMKGYYPAFSDIPAHDSIDDALQTIAACNVSIEINTSGSTKAVGGWYPSDDILERALHFGVQVTFGSDAHKPSRVGDELELVAKRLKEIGFTQWVFYRNRVQVAVLL